MHVEEHLDLTAFAVNLKLSAFRMPYNLLHGLDRIHFSQILVRDTQSNHSKSKPKTSYNLHIIAHSSTANVAGYSELS
jgi:hypothetical protein